MTELPTGAPAAPPRQGRRTRRTRTALVALCALAVVPAAVALGSPAATAAAPRPLATEPAEPAPATPHPGTPGEGVPQPDITHQTDPKPTPARPRVVVTVGDGFLAGEGARWAGNAEGLKNNGGVPQELRDATDRTRSAGVALEKIYTADCRRSDAVVLAAGDAGRHLNIACSGAATEQLSRPVETQEAQLEQLRKLATENDVSAVVVSVGGTDVRLTDTMATCADAWKDNRYCSTDPAITGPAGERTAAVGEKVAKAVRAVRAAVEGTGSAPRIVLQSYPLPLASGEAPATDAHDENSWDRWSAYGCPFYNRDLQWLAKDIGRALNAEIKKAAKAEGADFVELGRLLEGHQVCGSQPLQTSFAADGTVTSPTAAQAQWARYVPRARVQLPADEAREVLHPNYYGQQALSHCLTEVVGKLTATPDQPATRARCVGAADRAPQQITVSYGG
ncbi:GDSL-type esterase/lipase family protein [Streptomyces sp. NPDC048057]|uniref:GDSL-type esterase/lipase family protein n=1 Tax=Streptomyces sp. NPDC048057 TaxID=3155628 RepID=UPI0033DADBCF